MWVYPIEIVCLISSAILPFHAKFIICNDLKIRWKTTNGQNLKFKIFFQRISAPISLYGWSYTF